MKTIILNKDKIDVLFRQPSSAASGGGFQNLIAKLQKRCNRETGELSLDDAIEKRLERDVTQYGTGGWQNRLKKILKE